MVRFDHLVWDRQLDVWQRRSQVEAPREALHQAGRAGHGRGGGDGGVAPRALRRGEQAGRAREEAHLPARASTRIGGDDRGGGGVVVVSAEVGAGVVRSDHHDTLTRWALGSSGEAPISPMRASREIVISTGRVERSGGGGDGWRLRRVASGLWSEVVTAGTGHVFTISRWRSSFHMRTPNAVGQRGGTDRTTGLESHHAIRAPWMRRGRGRSTRARAVSSHPSAERTPHAARRRGHGAL
jgi:hypothetical protein